MSRKSLLLLFAFALLASPVFAQDDPHAGHTAPAPAQPGAAEPVHLDIPDVTVLDEQGNERRFYSDLVKGRVVAVNFLFTNCTTICPPLGATFGKLRKLLGERAGRDVHLISISVDPTNDTPARLKAWSAKFGQGPGWHLVTGERDEIVRLLKALGAYTADPNNHPPLVLVGNDARHTWTRAYGLAPPAKLAELIDQIAGTASPNRASGAAAAPEPSPPSPLPVPHRAFGPAHPPRARGATTHPEPLISRASLPLSRGGRARGTGRGGRGVRAQAKRIQARLGERLGRDVHILSITIDPEYDTPARLQEYAARLEAGPGWRFVTGKPEDVETVLRKLGLWAAAPEKHPAMLIFGNTRTGLWKKAFALADAEEVLTVAESVYDDTGATP